MLKTWQDFLKKWFKDSETLLKERVTVFFGVLFAVLAVTDYSFLFAIGVEDIKKQLAVAGVITAQGMIGEYLRKRRDETMSDAVIVNPEIMAGEIVAHLGDDKKVVEVGSPESAKEAAPEKQVSVKVP